MITVTSSNKVTTELQLKTFVYAEIALDDYIEKCQRQLLAAKTIGSPPGRIAWQALLDEAIAAREEVKAAQ